MKAYPKYKDSGIDWLGDVPDHWDVITLRRATTSIKNGTIADQDNYSNENYRVTRIETISSGTINYDKTGFVEYTPSLDKYKLENGDILFSHINSLEYVGNCAIYDLSEPLYSGMNLLRIVPANSFSPKYLLYWFKSLGMKFEVQRNSKPAINQVSIPIGYVKSLPILLQSLSEQQAIAAYLDDATSRIDALIEKKEQMIELLKEKRIALITHAVTKGLDPNVKMKDSGIEWLGQVPEHWVVAKVGSGYSIQLGKMLQPEQNLESELMIPYLKAINVQWDNITISEDNFMWGSSEEIVKYGIQKGDLLVCEGGEAGRSAILKEDIKGYIIQNALHRVRSNNNCVIYLKYLLQIASNLNWFDIICNKATIAHFTKDKFAEMVIPLPPKKEQQEIIASIEPIIVYIDTLIQKQEQMIELLTEYRSSLIHHAVTGKIDLRGYNAKTQ